MYLHNYAPAWAWRNQEMKNVTVKAKTDTNKACKLAPVIRHLSSKFEDLTGKCWVWPDMLTGLFRYGVKYKVYFHLRKTHTKVDF